MLLSRKLFAICAVILMLHATVGATSVSMKLSGPGVVDATTIKAGKPVTVDIYIENDKTRSGFAVGFKLSSLGISKIVHVADSGNGLNPAGDIKGYNGWNDGSIWDMGGVYVAERDWDGTLPELIGFGGISVHKSYEPTPETKCLSIDLLFNETGTIVIDSSFFPPTGAWMFAPPSHKAAWGGPYRFKVVE